MSAFTDALSTDSVRARRTPCQALRALALVWLVAGCSSGEEPRTGPVEQERAPADSGPASSASRASPSTGRAPAPVDVTGAEAYESQEFGALHGTILFQGKVPERFVLGAASSAECKHHPDVDQRKNDVVVADNKLAGVFVTLGSGFDRARIPRAPEAAVTLDQKGCMYVPRVLALRTGQVLRVTNEDPTNHNVHALSKRNSEVNKNMGAKQPPIEFRFERAEQPVPFKCDVHPWMGAAVFVEEHPWFAVSDAQGAFRIRDVPPGSYVVEAVHESLGKVVGSVAVEAGSSTGFTLTLSK